MSAKSYELADTIDRMADDAPMVDTRMLEAGGLAELMPSTLADYLASRPPLPRVGAVLAGRWRIEGKLGEGGFGAVFEGRDQQLGRRVAIKVMRADDPIGDAGELREAVVQLERRRRRFREEARAVARAESPNVVTVYDVGEEVPSDGGPSWPFLVMELVEGRPLDRVVRERPSPELALHILEQLARGVATLHARGVVHRDLKPGNVIVTGDGHVKIIDFGLAVASSEWTEVRGPEAAVGWIEGTLHYMSPEVIAGEPADRLADLWALGVIAYELTTGRSPWGEHLTPPELTERIARAEPLPLMRATDSGDARLAHLAPIVLKLLARERGDRFQSASELVETLAGLRVGPREPEGAQGSAQPFRYLLAFEERDAPWFHGREDVTVKLVLALEQRGRLLVAGPSGAGKTSLVQAGLIPALEVLRPLEVLRLHPGRSPLERLAAAISSAVALDPQALRARPGLVGERLREHARKTMTRVLVQVDALEELVTQEAPAAEVEIFAQALDGLRDDAGQRVLLVMAVRDEYLGRLPRLSRALEPVLRAAEFLGPPTRREMIAALVGPAERCGYRWEPGLAEEMVDAVAAQVSPLPVLQLAASWLWETENARGPAEGERGDAGGGAAGERVLRRALLAAPGEDLRIGDVLGQYADHKLRAASWSAADRALVLRMLPAMVSADGAPLQVPIDEIVARCPRPARGRELLRDLTDFRLLTSLRDERARECLTPAHTHLIQGWGLWREALEGNAELESFLRRFARDAKEWADSGRDPAKLWPVAAARELERWAPRLGEVELTAEQVAFREALVASTRRARLVRWGLAGFLVALAIAGVVIGLAFSAQADEANALRQASDEHRREADELIDYMLGDLRHRLEPIGQVKLLESVADKARAYLDARAGTSPEDRRRRAAVLRNLSAVFLSEGRSDAAEEASREALAIVEQLAREAPDDPAAQLELASSELARGHLLVQRGDPIEAAERYRAARAIYDARIAQHPDDRDTRFQLMVVNDRLGDVLARLGELDDAREAQGAAHAYARELAAADPGSARAKRNVLITGSKVGAVPSAMGDGMAARLTEEQFRAFEALAQANPNVGQAQYDLMLGQLGRANELAARGEHAASLELYRAALATIERVAAADPDSAGNRSDVAFCHNKLGSALQLAGDLAGAMREHDAARAILERLVAADPGNTAYERDLAHSWNRLGEARLAAGDIAGAVAAQEVALKIAERHAADAPSHESDLALARALGFHARALASAGQREKARAEIERARARMARLLDRAEPPRAWTELDAWLAGLAP